MIIDHNKHLLLFIQNFSEMEIKHKTVFIVDLGYLINQKDFKFDQKYGPNVLKKMFSERFNFEFQHLLCFTAVKDPAEQWVIRSNKVFTDAGF